MISPLKIDEKCKLYDVAADCISDSEMPLVVKNGMAKIVAIKASPNKTYPRMKR